MNIVKDDESGNVTMIKMTKPDDWHVHLRDGVMLQQVVFDSARQFGRVLAMPNLNPPVVTVEEATAYREKILTANGLSTLRRHFNPYMTLYLTDNTKPREIRQASESEWVIACKLYPAGATTNSDSGVTDIKKIYHVLEEMEKRGVVLCVHGEVTDPSVDIFDREAVFISEILKQIVYDFPGLKIVLEHITTKEGVQFVEQAPTNVAATITAHHLLINRNALLVGGIRPHNYCLPVAKREENRQALVGAATCGNPKFFLGTDSAPHTREKKESPCGCAGCYTAYNAIALYAQAFERVDALPQLEAFASRHGADFYGLPHNEQKVTMIREDNVIPPQIDGTSGSVVVPFMAGESLRWKQLTRNF